MPTDLTDVHKWYDNELDMFFVRISDLPLPIVPQSLAIDGNEFKFDHEVVAANGDTVGFNFVGADESNRTEIVLVHTMELD